MTLTEIKTSLNSLEKIAFKLPDGSFVPSHFHVTEVGVTTKDFIDCGGTLRHEKKINFQLWEADDYDHQIHPEKLLDIINISNKKLGLGDFEIEVEYQGSTINLYSLGFDGTNFLLENKQTDCLAKDNCGVPEVKTMVDLSSLTADAPAGGSCTPGSGCC